MQFFMGGDTGARLLPLFGSFEQKFSDFAAAQTLHEVEKRAMFESAPATAIGFATSQVLFDVGRPQEIRGDENLLQHGDFLLSQGIAGMLAPINCLSHEYT